MIKFRNFTSVIRSVDHFGSFHAQSMHALTDIFDDYPFYWLPDNWRVSDD
jgi:hypothetical protein